MLIVLIMPNNCTSGSNGSNCFVAFCWSSKTVAIIYLFFYFILFLPPASPDTTWLSDWLLLYSIWYQLEWCLAYVRHSVNTSEWVGIIVVTSDSCCCSSLSRRAAKSRESVIFIFIFFSPNVYWCTHKELKL